MNGLFLRGTVSHLLTTLGQAWLASLRQRATPEYRHGISALCLTHNGNKKKRTSHPLFLSCLTRLDPLPIQLSDSAIGNGVPLPPKSGSREEAYSSETMTSMSMSCFPDVPFVSNMSQVRVSQHHSHHAISLTSVPVEDFLRVSSSTCPQHAGLQPNSFDLVTIMSKSIKIQIHRTVLIHRTNKDVLFDYLNC